MENESAIEGIDGGDVVTVGIEVWELAQKIADALKPDSDGGKKVTPAERKAIRQEIGDVLAALGGALGT